ncbi:MAG: hypothetical protein M1826_001134 [Phylliscum demangeonii]|nr:MAG: hypothetical protein M1826_001134 [Phylliscum demangeonii]
MPSLLLLHFMRSSARSMGRGQQAAHPALLPHRRLLSRIPSSPPWLNTAGNHVLLGAPPPCARPPRPPPRRHVSATSARRKPASKAPPASAMVPKRYAQAPPAMSITQKERTDAALLPNDLGLFDGGELPRRG